jgi:hypothetical protein
MTQYEFLKKARKIHGFKYIYDYLPYKVTGESVIRVIYNGNYYEQKVNKHLMGRCPEKTTPMKTTQQFILEAKQVWGDKYDYSLVDYQGAHKKVKIIHDGIIYEQTPISHLSKSPEFRMSQESFIELAKRKWGDKYDYSLVDYKDCKSKVKIIHKKTGLIYEQRPESHLRAAPELRSVRMETHEFIQKAKNIQKDKYDYSKTCCLTYNNKLTIICPMHGEFVQTANSHLSGMGCKRCGVKQKNYVRKPKYTTEEFIEAAKEKWGDKYDYSLTEYKNSKTKVKIIHDGIIYEQMSLSHFKYPPEQFLNQEIFLIKARRKWGDKYDYSLVNFISTHHRIKIIFQGVLYEQLPNNHLKYAPEKRNISTPEEFVTESREIHNNKYSYEKSVYINRSQKIVITCPIHGDFEQRPDVHLRGSGCKKCSESTGEKKVAKVLNEMGIEFKREHFFENCKNIFYLKFDFYLPSYRTCIEFDGIQHFEPLEVFGGVETFERLKKNDEIKNQYCEDNFIDLIRIRYDRIDSISDVLWEALKFKILKRN